VPAREHRGAVARAPFIDHFTLSVRDVGASRRFYEQALAPFRVRVLEEPAPPHGWGPAVVFGPEGSEDFAIAQGTPAAALHFAFLAPNRAAVDAFHAAAVAAGGVDNGAPGVREHYHRHYYAAYVLDPDHNNIEAVCHEPPAGG